MTCPLVFVINDPYVPYMSVTMQSVIDNASTDNTYIFYVLYRDLRAETMEQFKSYIRQFPHFSIEFIDVSSYIEGRKLRFRHWSPEVFFKQLAPYVLTGHDKLLYLDSDIVVNIDVAQLFTIDLGGHILAAGREHGAIGIVHALTKQFGKTLPAKHRAWLGSILELKNPDDYFNSGVLLFNAPAFRSEINFDELMDAAGAREWANPDQDLLNVFCEGKIQFLPIKYNFLVHYWGSITYLPEQLRVEYDEAKENPAVLHFIDKPWRNAFNIWYFPYFWAYAARSPYFNEIRRRMLENGCLSDYPENWVSEYLKRWIKTGKKSIRPALITMMKSIFIRIHRKLLS